MTKETSERRAISLLVLFGSILYMVVTWNYRGTDEPPHYKRPSET
jgi:hypothetical protein